MLDELQAERAKLDLRRVKAEHRRLDDEEAERARQARERKEAARRQAEAEVLVREQARLEAEERRERQEAEARRHRQRREIIQRVKDRAMNRFVSLFVTIPGELEARARAAIERELTNLPVEELPESELLAIAEGIREGLYRPEIERQQAERERERQARQEENARAWARVAEESKAFAERLAQERERQATERQREAKKRELIGYGGQVASKELDEEGLRPGSERDLILRRVEQELESQLTGTENRGKVEDLVEEILDEELGEE